MEARLIHYTAKAAQCWGVWIQRENEGENIYRERVKKEAKTACNACTMKKHNSFVEFYSENGATVESVNIFDL